MTNHHDTNIGRRPVLKGAGVTLGTLGGLTGSVAAKQNGEKSQGGHLRDSEAEFLIYWSEVANTANDPDAPADFGFPKGPYLGGTDPGDGEGLFDAGDIEISPNQQTLHHSLRVFAGLVMEGKAKPYTLVNVGDGVFESRGQVTNFEARSKGEIVSRLTKALMQIKGFSKQVAKGLAEQLAGNPPLSTLAGRKWRAVATDGIKVDLSSEEPPFDVNWAVTRVDFYSRGGGKPEYTLSLLYTIWDGSSKGKGGAFGRSRAFINQGRLNKGGQ